MTTHISKQLSKRQSGFTFLEVLVVMVIFSLLSVAVSMVMITMFKVNASSSNRVTVIRQVQNTGMWVSRDVQMAQHISIGADHLPEVLWTDWEGVKYKVDYEYDNVVASDLVREYYVKNIIDPDYVLISRDLVAHYIDHATTNFVQSSGVYKLTVTAVINGFSANGTPVEETRTYEILPRAVE
jgi:prepilin-type N-terminal cleavage/methylation domain-containing protein